MTHPQALPASIDAKNRRVSPTRIVKLAESGEFSSMRCIGDHVGLTRERVRQVLRSEGVSFRKKQEPTLLRWPCPDCGTIIERSSLVRNNWRKLPAHCRPCAQVRCPRGHLKVAGQCLPCQRAWTRTIIRYRVCVDCGEEIAVTRNDSRQEKRLNRSLKRCRPCWAKRLAKLGQTARREGAQ